jgi:OOP family OmpA-OmpF porin
MEKYSAKGLTSTLKKISASDGKSPLDKALSAATADLQPLAGKSAIIILSDGMEMPNAAVTAAAQSIKNTFGDKLCLYTVHIGNDVEGATLLSQVASTGSCGFRTNADSLSSPKGMAEFVEAVFLEKAEKIMLDSDDDGVNDDKDKCPNTPKGVAVDANGCPLDSDGDGVFDYLDKCPDTPAGMQVDNTGCPLSITKPLSIDLLVEFDFDKSDIRPIYHNHLKAVAEFLKANPKTRLLLEGHTDWEGTPAYNLGLSERRANSVKNYLVTTFGLERTRLATKGYGETQPVSTNDSEEGRQRNRRVIAKFYNF